MEEFLIALSVMWAAQAVVSPCKFLVMAVSGFLKQTWYSSRHFRSAWDELATLTEFMDNCLQESAQLWRLGRPFLVTVELSGWSQLFNAKLGVLTAAKVGVGAMDTGAAAD